MKHVPDMDHLRPDLQIYAHVGRTGRLGQLDRIVEQGFRSTDLNQQWGKTGKVGVDRRCQSRARVGAV